MPWPGTEGSNPPPSSGESTANLTSRMPDPGSRTKRITDVHSARIQPRYVDWAEETAPLPILAPGCVREGIRQRGGDNVRRFYCFGGDLKIGDADPDYQLGLTRTGRFRVR